MTVKNVIILTFEGRRETWGSLTKICDTHGINYSEVVRKKFPFEHKGFEFEKVKLNEQTIFAEHEK